MCLNITEELFDPNILAAIMDYRVEMLLDGDVLGYCCTQLLLLNVEYSEIAIYTTKPSKIDG
jgi:hypothetical protein